MSLARIDTHFIESMYSSEKTVAHYKQAVTQIGLWESERRLCQHYFAHSDHLLDIGCGTGRTTMGLHQLGYTAICGVDLAATMIREAQILADTQQYNINWIIANVVDLPFPNETYDGALFSFNGLELIPGRRQRLQTMAEIHRVLKPDGCFIFTTHDRERGDIWDAAFWEAEKQRWQRGEQDSRLTDFGDLIIVDNEHNVGQEIYMHIASRDDIIIGLNQVGFTLVEDRWRPEICIESIQVQHFSLDCRFWIVRKI